MMAQDVTQTMAQTPLAQSIMEFLEDTDGWLTRSDIGSHLERRANKLSDYDVAVLRALVDSGRIEEREKYIGKRKRFEYRVKGIKTE